MDIARNRLIKRSVMGLAAAGVGVALLWALWPKPVAVEVAQLSRGALLVTVEDEGKTRIKDVYTVSAPITRQACAAVFGSRGPCQEGHDHSGDYRAHGPCLS